MEKFMVAEAELLAQGHEVFNPAKLEVVGGAPWEWYLARDLKHICEERPSLYMLKGWEDSLGARLEKEFATLLGLPIEFEGAFIIHDPAEDFICDDCQ